MLQKYKEAKPKARAASYAEALKNKPENKDKERAQKIASDAQTQIENNLESMLSSHFTKLENKITFLIYCAGKTKCCSIAAENSLHMLQQNNNSFL